MLSAGQAIDRWVVRSVTRDGREAIVEDPRRGLAGVMHVLPEHADLLPILLAERREHAAFVHPGVVALLDVVALGEAPAIVLERAAGPTLAEVLDGEAPAIEEAEATFRAILAAVDAAHARGLLLLDLEPATVRLDGTTPRIAGLGRFGVLDRALGPCAAPELRAGAPGDVRSDLFSLGCLLYHLCTGRPALDSGDLLAPTPAGAPRALPPRLGRAIRGCLTSDPDDRIQSCAELLAVVDGTAFPPLARPKPSLSAVPAAYRDEAPARPDAPRQLALGLLAGLPLAAVVVGLGFTLGFSLRRAPDLGAVAGPPALAASLGSALVPAIPLCDAPRGTPVGWVEGATGEAAWRIRSETPVYPDRPRDGVRPPVACRLAPGSAVRRYEPSVRAGAETWTAIYLDER